MIHIAFCDDNIQFLGLLRDSVEQECKKLFSGTDDYFIGPALGSGESVLEYIADHPIDLLFLDIDMPGMSGFDIAKRLCTEYPQLKIVFVSAYDNYVYSSFEYYPVAFLRKSWIADELPKVLKRIVESIRAMQRRITLLTNEGERNIILQDVAYIESDRNYCKVYMLHNKVHICRCTMASLEEQVKEFDFFRIHSAFLINLVHVERILSSGEVLLRGQKFPVAQRRMHEFRKVYMDYSRRA